MLLKQIDYFQDSPEPYSDNFYKEIQFHMEEHIYQAGSEILASGEKCLNIYFIVNGIVDLEVFDSKGNAQPLGQLVQGDLIGQYSALFSEDLSFSVISKTQVRMLTLPERFFSSFSDKMN